MTNRNVYILTLVGFIFLIGMVHASTTYYPTIVPGTDVQTVIDSDKTMVPNDQLVLKYSSTNALLYTITYNSWSDKGDGSATFTIVRADLPREPLSVILPDTDLFTSSDPSQFEFHGDLITMKIDECAWTNDCLDVELLKVKLGARTPAVVEVVNQQQQASKDARVNPIGAPNKLNPIKVYAKSDSLPLPREGQEPNLTFTRQNTEPVELQFDESTKTIYVGKDFDLSAFATGTTDAKMKLEELDKQVTAGKGKKVTNCTIKPNFNYSCKIMLDELLPTPTSAPAGGTGAQEKEYTLSYIADNGDGVIFKDEVGFIRIKPIELNVVPSQDSKPLTRTMANTYEFNVAKEITLTFSGQYKNEKKFIVLQDPNATSAGSNKINPADAKTFDGDLFYGEVYSITSDTAIVNKIAGIAVDPKKSFTIEYAHIQPTGTLSSGTVKLVGNQNKLTVNANYSAQSVPNVVSPSDPVLREGQGNTFVLEKDSPITISVVGIKAGKTTYVGLGSSFGSVKLADITGALNTDESARTNFVDGKYIKIDPDKNCKPDSSRLLQCTFSVQKINGQPLTKETAFTLTFYHESELPTGGTDPTFTSNGMITIRFKSQNPACKNLLECMTQLDQKIAQSYK